MAKQPVVLAILDGFGISYRKEGNALYLAKTPNLQYISENYPGALLEASGTEVGLSWGEMGSSEVGHANLGAGLVVYQNLERINKAIADKSFFALPAWKKAVEHASKNNSDVHIMGLISNGGIHSHIDHLMAILEAIENLGFGGNVFIHVFPDGQDVAPASALKFIKMLERKMGELKIGKIATVIGRFYSMDKNENWDRTKKAYDLLTAGTGEKATDAKMAIAASYEKGTRDENMEPVVITDEKGNPAGLVKENDVLIFINFRADRARQLSGAFIFSDFDRFPVKKFKNLLFIPMMSYGANYNAEPAFPLQEIKNPLAKVVSDGGKAQFHIAETEKYAHVTYFFNGGIETPFPGEERVIIPSAKVKSYDQKPEMSAYEILKRLVSEIKTGKYDFLVANFANSDLVAHTGNLKAGIKAIEVIDECIGNLMKETLAGGGTLVITADHGNAEEMINLETGEIDKEHSVNPVPLWIIGPQNKKSAPEELKTPGEPAGILADVAPTILEIMGIPKPEEMTGMSLLNVISSCPLLK